MQFIFSGDAYQVARVTGPQHNLLGISLGDGTDAVDVVALPIRAGDAARIDRNDVLAQVMAGLQTVNHTLGKRYAISRILFVPSDTPSPSVYALLTVELIQRIDQQGEFLVFD
ncbi:hypothetical protein [Massilia pseudoviolaceinigra]|uniref:hypothetical protein n=1 Tax=Massilia pseudoviolaceinigra TaxID=3057165 RepID=UPI00279664DC|nr:hypothetical protein [Massilia sp. CCM 9206]MDQ1920231.1 hypothetical protein [Massilia sp. CCM 9206]